MANAKIEAAQAPQSETASLAEAPGIAAPAGLPRAAGFLGGAPTAADDPPAGLSEAATPFIADYAPAPAYKLAPEAASIYGALDLGTNNCRLIVVRPSARGFTIMDTFSRIIRLGEGMSKTGALSAPAMDRAIEALKICADKMQRSGVNRSRLIATEACRAARNSAEFLNRVRRETGLELEIITREMEARLAVAGCASLIDRSSDWALVFDIGGGSSELIWLDLSRRRKLRVQTPGDRLKLLDCIAAWTSLPFGVVTLAEQFGGRNLDGALFEAMVGVLTDELKAFDARHGISARIEGKETHLLGTSGTVTTIAGVHLALPFYNRSKVDGTWLTSAEVRAVSGRLLDMGYAGRVAQPCIGPDRADLVLSGCAILEAMMRVWPCERLRVADRGLREGILTSLMAEDGDPGLHGHKRRRQSRPRFDN